MKQTFPLTVFVVTALTLPSIAQQQTAAERAAALKATMAASKIALRQYEWVETTVVKLKGEEKLTERERCHYGPDGNIQKAALAQPPADAKKPGRKAQKKQAELTGYVKEAANLVRQYVPLDDVRIQLAKDAGGVSIQTIDPGKRARITFTDYLKRGDNLAVDLDLTNNRPLSADVATYFDTDKAPVTVTVQFRTIDGDTVYPSEAILNAEKKNLTVTIQNSGYRKMAQ